MIQVFDYVSSNDEQNETKIPSPPKTIKGGRTLRNRKKYNFSNEKLKKIKFLFLFLSELIII